jgi:hypothetical protein
MMEIQQTIMQKMECQRVLALHCIRIECHVLCNTGPVAERQFSFHRILFHSLLLSIVLLLFCSFLDAILFTTFHCAYFRIICFSKHVLSKYMLQKTP